jgi:hypothetical protein
MPRQRICGMCRACTVSCEVFLEPESGRVGVLIGASELERSSL